MFKIKETLSLFFRNTLITPKLNKVRVDRQTTHISLITETSTSFLTFGGDLEEQHGFPACPPEAAPDHEPHDEHHVDGGGA